MEIVNYIFGKIGDCVLDSIKIHFGYLENYDDNITALENQLETLEEMERDVHEAIEAAERNGEVIRKNVQHWIASVEGVKMEARKFLEDNVKRNKRCFRGWFPDVKTRYLLSTEAMEKHKKIERLREEQKVFDVNVSLPAPPPGIDSINSKDIVLFQTTKFAMEQVMGALKKNCTHFVGIHGMGGVGKTTLVKEIARKCKEEKLFDNVAIAVVSQTITVKSIQDQIADFLGLKLGGKGEMIRAARLCDRIKKEDKILLILDDVWEKLELNTIDMASPNPNRIGTLLPGVSTFILHRCGGFRNIIPHFMVGRDSLAVLRTLRVKDSSELESLINTEEECKIPYSTCFSFLEVLALEDLECFRGLGGMVLVDMPHSFTRLKELTIYRCPKMSHIVIPFDLLRRMRQLEYLDIGLCNAVEYLFDLKEEEEAEDAVQEEEGILVNLKIMWLRRMYNLEQLWKGPIGLVHLRNLETVFIRGCPKLKVVFHWSEAQTLEQLKDLKVVDCEELEDIVGRDTGEEAAHKVLFPELQRLEMEKLPKLVGFYTGNLPGSQSTPKLKTLDSYSYDPKFNIAVEGKNLDTVIKEHKELLL